MRCILILAFDNLHFEVGSVALSKGSSLSFYLIVIDSPSSWFETFRCLDVNLGRHVRDSVNRYIEYLMLQGCFDKVSFLLKSVSIYKQSPEQVKLFQGSLEKLYKEFL